MNRHPSSLNQPSRGWTRDSHERELQACIAQLNSRPHLTQAHVDPGEPGSGSLKLGASPLAPLPDLDGRKLVKVS